MKLVKSIVGVTVANIVNFGTSFIIGFFLPAILSISEYGYYKEYTLYLSFAYLFNIGFNDGIYIKYGGKNIEDIDKAKVSSEHKFIVLFQGILFIPMILVSIYFSNLVLFLFSISTFLILIITYHQNFLQAIGNFSTFSKGNISKSILYIVLLLFGIFILKSKNYIVYIVINILAFSALLVFFELNFREKIGYTGKINIRDSIIYFRIGIFILLANMSLTFVGNIGNWIVNWGFSIEEFAQYSFHNSLLNIILLVISAVGQVFYNLISKYYNKNTLIIIKKMSLLFGVISCNMYFVFSIIIKIFLHNYASSLDILKVIYISIPYLIVSKILIANMYKALRSERKYFKDSLVYGLFSFLLVGLAYFLTKNVIFIATAITLSYILWFIYTTRVQFKELKGNFRELALLLSHLVIFLIITTNFNDFNGLLLYAGYSIFVLFAFKNDLISIFRVFSETI